MKSASLTIPVVSLSWLKLAHPINPCKTLSLEDETDTAEFSGVEQFMMYCKAIIFWRSQVELSK